MLMLSFWFKILCGGKIIILIINDLENKSKIITKTFGKLKQSITFDV